MYQHSKSLLGGLLTVQAVFLSATFETWLVVSVVTTLSVLMVAIRSGRATAGEHRGSRLPRWLRWIALTLFFAVLIAITAAWRLGSHFGSNINPIFVGGDMLAHALMFSALVVWTLRPRDGHLSLLPMGLVLVLICVAAGGASRSLAAQTTVALAACIGYCVASQLILGGPRRRGAAAMGTNSPARSSDPQGVWLSPLFSLMTLSLLLMATSAVANVTERMLPGIQDGLKSQLQASMDAIADDSYLGGTRYVQGSRLGSVRHHLLGDPQEVALRVHADAAPGYLRGNVFDTYRTTRWHSATASVAETRSENVTLRDRIVEPVGPGSIPLRRSAGNTLQRFPLAESPPGRTVSLEIHNDPMKGSVIFMPLGAQWIEAKGRELVLTHHQTVRLGIDVTNPYVVGADRLATSEPMSDERRNLLLDIPASTQPEIQRLTQRVCRGQNSPTGKAAAISRFFQDGFRYSLNSTQSPVDVDPLAYFLRSRHPAHCEYFASATVLMLRAAGVPSRYVTGYVADQRDSEIETLWLARNRDAHAWAEAYDASNGQWFAVESTPGRSYQTVDPNRNNAAGQGFLFDVFGESDQDDNEGIFSRVTGWILSMRATDPLLLLLRFAQLPLFLVLAILLWSKYFRNAALTGDAGDQQSRKWLRQVDRRVRKTNLVRNPSETLYQFAGRIESQLQYSESKFNDMDRDLLSTAARWYRQYADARYQGQLPQPFADSQQRVAAS